MVLDTMTLEELIREIKTDFSEVKGRWKNYVRKFRKTAQKRTMFPWLWEANIKTRRFNEWYISFYAESKKEVGILNPTFTMLFKYTLNPQLHSRSATYIKRNGLLIRKITIKSSRPFQCAYHPLTP